MLKIPVVLLILLCAMALPAPRTALAQDVPRLQDQVTDLSRNQVLSSGRSRIDAAISQLRESRNVQLFVLFVESTGARSVTDYADEVARRNSLGGNDVLLVVAMADRSDALWRGDQMADRLTDRELSDILSNRVEPLLGRGDFAGAVAATSEGIGQADAASGASSSLPGGLGSSLMPILLAALAVVGGLWAWKAFSSRRRQQQAAAEVARQTEQRAQEANSLLIQADDTLREADEEIGFAEAQFGEAEVVPYREAVASASTQLKAAFALRQQLDDAVPESPEERRRIVEQIIEHATLAQTALTEQKQRIEQLRDLERRAPEILAALPAQLDATEARVPEAERTLAGLRRYADASWSAVAGDVERARELIAQARAAASEGQHAITANDSSAAGKQARVGQQGLAEAGHLLDAIQSLAVTLQQAEQAVGSQISAAEADVRAARSSLNGHATIDLNRRVAEAEGALSQAQREIAATKPDVLAASRLATQADTMADAVLAELRQEEERREREQRIVASQLQAAEAAYARAANYIAARRRGLGWEARTRLTEAERHLSQARGAAETDAQAAVAESRRAQDLAEEAYTLAQQDFYAGGSYGGFGGLSRGGVIPIPFPVPTGGWDGGGGWGGGGWSGGGGVSGGGGGGSVGGRW